jgi:hypothetical protein
MNNGKVVEGSGRELILIYNAGIFLDGLKETTEIRTDQLPNIRQKHYS